MNTQQIELALNSAFPDAIVEVLSDDEVHFEVRIISQRFAGQRPIQRHQMVYAALGDAVGGDIHALSIKTMTPAEVDSPSG